MTNGWWAKSTRAATSSIENFADAGLDEIEFSTGDQHARFVSVDSIGRGVAAAVAQGLPVTVIVELTQDRLISGDTISELPDVSSTRAKFPERQLNIFESPWMPVDPALTADYPHDFVARKSNIGQIGGCEDVLRTITIGPDGAISACCGIGQRLVPQLQLGNIASTSVADAVKAAESDPIKWRIRCEGPEHILAWAESIDPDIEWEGMYAHRCQACIRLHTDPKVCQILEEHYGS